MNITSQPYNQPLQFLTPFSYIYSKVPTINLEDLVHLILNYSLSDFSKFPTNFLSVSPEIYDYNSLIQVSKLMDRFLQYGILFKEISIQVSLNNLCADLKLNKFTPSLDYFSILQVNRNANSEQIKSQYKILAKLNHPDKQGGDTTKMQLINTAYSYLKDPVQRRQYRVFLRGYLHALIDSDHGYLTSQPLVYNFVVNSIVEAPDNVAFKFWLEALRYACKASLMVMNKRWKLQSNYTRLRDEFYNYSNNIKQNLKSEIVFLEENKFITNQAAINIVDPLNVCELDMSMLEDLWWDELENYLNPLVEMPYNATLAWFINYLTNI
jgi:DnaJ-domain-containing protein 1